MLLRTVVYHANDQACLSAEPINNVSIDGFELRVSWMDGLGLMVSHHMFNLKKYELFTNIRAFNKK